MESIEECCICHHKLSEKPTVRVKLGLRKLLTVSTMRDDGRRKYFENVESVEVHVECRKKYTCISQGLLSYTDFPSETTNERPGLTFSPKKKNLRRSNELFNFEKNCFICGKEADLLKLKKQALHKRKTKIHKVTNVSFTENLLLRTSTRLDEHSKEILKRISCVDLVSKNAVYHKNCYTLYCMERPEPKENEHQKKIEEYMKKVYKFIEESEDSQFVLRDIVNKIGKYVLTNFKIIILKI